MQVCFFQKGYITKHFLKCSQTNPGNPKFTFMFSAGTSHPFISAVIWWFKLILQWLISRFLHYLSVLSVLNTSSLLCDCHMQWLGPWLTDSQFQQSVSAICAHPASLLGRSVLSISAEEFVCGQSNFFFPFSFHFLYCSQSDPMLVVSSELNLKLLASSGKEHWVLFLSSTR